MLTLYYERVSTDRQSESGLGIEAQRKRNLKVAALMERPSDLPLFFTDSGVSAATPFQRRHAGYTLMTAVMRAAAFHGAVSADADIVLISYSLDRLFRDVDDGRATMKWFDERGVRVILSNEGGNAIDTSTAMGRFLLTLRLAQGELERGLTGERTKAALGALQARGGKVGEPPYGWRKTEVKATFEENPEEQNVIRIILLLDEEQLSAREIARRLNSTGHKSRDGKEWSHTQVLRILGRENEGD